MLLDLAHHQQPLEHLVQLVRVQGLDAVPHGAVGDAGALRLQVEQVGPGLGGLGTV